MALDYTLLYRGPLSSCNFSCSYCPFGKVPLDKAGLAADKALLSRFANWVESQNVPLSIFFVPRGEALVHEHYRREIARLSHMKFVRKIAVQTNLSCDLEWLDNCEREKIALWSTLHPKQVPVPDFMEKCRHLNGKSVRFSVGMVGVRENIKTILQVRKQLPSHIYLWINAIKKREGYYDGEEIATLSSIDPYFPSNLEYYKCEGEYCRCGNNVFAVHEDGTIRQCLFSREILGRLGNVDIGSIEKANFCLEKTCHCFIGYVHLKRAGLYDVFKEGMLERIPVEWPLPYNN